MTHVLVAVNTPNVRDRLRGIFEPEGWSVVEATRPDIAVELAKRLLPHVILFDGDDALFREGSFVMQLKQDPITCNIPLVELTRRPPTDPVATPGVAERCRLPLYPGDILVQVQRLMLASRAVAGPSALLAMTDAAAIHLLTTLLRELGYVVEHTTDGFEAITQTRRSHPALIVLGDLAGRTDGLQVLRLLKADAELKGLPVIVVTAAPPESEARQMIAAHADVACVPLPLDTAVFLRAVGQLRGQR